MLLKCTEPEVAIKQIKYGEGTVLEAPLSTDAIDTGQCFCVATATYGNEADGTPKNLPIVDFYHVVRGQLGHPGILHPYYT